MTHHTTPDGIAYVRTPDERFVGLDDFPYEPKYGSVDGLRMAYIDEGPEDAHPVVLLHGEPSWSYLYRRMIPTLLDAGYRVLAPDLIGLVARTNRPTGVLHLRPTRREHRVLPRRERPRSLHPLRPGLGWPHRLATGRTAARAVARVAIGNTGLPVGESIGPGFDFWLAYSQESQLDDIGALFGRAVTVENSPITRRPPTTHRSPPPITRSVPSSSRPSCPSPPSTTASTRTSRHGRGSRCSTVPSSRCGARRTPCSANCITSSSSGYPCGRSAPSEFTPGRHFLQDDQGEASQQRWSTGWRTEPPVPSIASL